MNIFDVLLGRAISLDEAEEDLGRPEKEEETNLSLHVARCAKRWAMSYRSSRNNSAQLMQVRLLLVVLIVVAILYWPPIQKFFGLMP